MNEKEPGLLIDLLNCKNDEDFKKLGYNKTVGQLIELIDNITEQDKIDHCRYWIYENTKTNHQIIIVDNGNSWGHYICDYDKETFSIEIFKRAYNLAKKLCKGILEE